MKGKGLLVAAITTCLGQALLGCGGMGQSDPKAIATDYSQSRHWLSIPATIDKPVDVFYLYPTAWASDPATPKICAIDEPTMLIGAPAAFGRQATAFLTVANVFAPYYRQDNLCPTNRDRMVAGIPTTDGIAAFDYYIKHYNNGRPFILASHSQGSAVMANLLSRYMNNNRTVYKRMIAAYVIGVSVTADYLAANPHLRFAQGPTDTGVIISYNTQAPDVVPGANPVTEGIGLVINPITWTRSEALATTAEGLGSFMPNPQTGTFVQIPQYADAKIDTKNGVLICSTADEAAMYKLTGSYPGVYHSFDYLFYYYNIRQNAADRIAAYMGQKKPATSNGELLPLGNHNTKAALPSTPPASHNWGM